MQPLDTDVLVIGAGIAGLAVALSLANRRVTVLSPWSPPGGTASAMAQGGIAAAVGADDDPAQHMEDTLRAGAGACDPDAVLHFPAGLPGFEELREFVCLTQTESTPLVYLQSTIDPVICFVTLPAQVIEPNYQFRISAEEGDVLGVNVLQPPSASEILCLAILSAGVSGTPTANLLSPLLINTSTRIGMQVVQAHSQYDWRHPLPAADTGEARCS